MKTDRSETINFDEEMVNESERRNNPSNFKFKQSPKVLTQNFEIAQTK